MKKIKFPNRAGIEITIPPGNSISIDPNEILENFKFFRKRGQKTFQCSLDIEEYIKELLTNMLFSNDESNKDFLRGVLLDSPSCTFASKKKILNSSLSYFGILKGKERNELDNCLASIIKYRNAFAHGKIYHSKTPDKELFVLEYFEGNKQTKELNEEYWDTLETELNRAFELLANLEKSISVLHENQSE